ncbi:MAG TPA: hypothetical protein VIG72_00275 [Pontibacter sp.]
MRDERDNRGRGDWQRGIHRDQYHQAQHNQNATNRWGEPHPLMGPQPHEWHWQQERDNLYGSNIRDNWQPFEQYPNRHPEGQARYSNQEQDWHRGNRDASRHDQHAEDRWHPDRFAQHHPEQPYHQEPFYREQRRRRP